MSSESKLAVVTGAGSGIGREVAKFLSERGVSVVAAGRRLEALEETANLCSGEVECVSADLATDEGCVKLAGTVDREVAYLFHGAGRMPFQTLAATDRRTWRQILAINLSARLFLTQELLPRLSSGSRILVVGSMSAFKARSGASAYCVTYAASKMLVDCFRVEFADRGILSTVAIPGIVDTALMEGALAADPKVFPDRAEYASFADSGRLIDPSRVGRFFAWMLTSTSDDEYGEREWDIRDETHHESWLGEDPLFGLRSDER